MTIRQLLAGCWSGCELIWTANVLQCIKCGSVREVLPQAAIRGPAHDPEPVRGQATGKAKVLRTGNVREWKRSER